MALDPDFRQDDGALVECASPAFVILDLIQDPELRTSAFVALGPDFRQDDGVCGWASPASVILDLIQDPELRASAFVALGPDFSQDDGVWGVRVSRFRHPGLDPGSRVAGVSVRGSGS